MPDRLIADFFKFKRNMSLEVEGSSLLRYKFGLEVLSTLVKQAIAQGKDLDGRSFNDAEMTALKNTLLKLGLEKELIEKEIKGD